MSTYYYVVDDIEYTYTIPYGIAISGGSSFVNIEINNMKDKTIYYNSSNPNVAIAEYEVEVGFLILS